MSGASPAPMEEHASGCRLPPGYGGLLDGAVHAFDDDPRVRAAWVHGSVARGDADEVSDLDLIIAVDDDDLVEFAAGWRERLERITPTVMARPSFGKSGSWLAVTPSCQRFDLWVEPSSRIESSPVTDRLVLFDHDRLTRRVPPSPPPAPPSPAKLRELSARFRRAASVARVADELLMLQVIWVLRFILYETYVELHRPLPTTGLKQWSAKLSAGERERFAGLPTSGDPAPILVALEEALGRLPADLPPPDLPDVVVPPEGVIRGMTAVTAEPGTWGRHVAEEYLALSLYLTVSLHRGDWLLGVVGANDPRKLLYELMLDAAGRPPAESPADWSGRLTAEQRRDLLAIPAGTPDRRGVVGAHLAGREVFTRRGRELLGAAWPATMAEAVIPHVDGAIAGALEAAAGRAGDPG